MKFTFFKNLFTKKKEDDDSQYLDKNLESGELDFDKMSDLSEGDIEEIEEEMEALLEQNPQLKSLLKKSKGSLKKISLETSKKPKKKKLDNLQKKQTEQIREEHIKQFADAVNNIGDNPSKGKWAKYFSDTAIEERTGGGEKKGR